MEDEQSDKYLSEMLQNWAGEFSEEQIQESLDKIDTSKKNIEKLNKKKDCAYKRGSIRVELKKILEELPKEVKVLNYAKDTYASRAEKDDQVIRVWHKKDLDKYCEKLEELFTSKALQITFPRRWE